jgi:hypothetical protein
MLNSEGVIPMTILPNSATGCYSHHCGFMIELND